MKRSLAYKRKHTAIKYVTLFCVLVLLLLTFFGCGNNAARNGEGILRVHYLDVGQSDCAFVEFSDDFTMLVDASDSEHAELVCDYIRALGHSDIDVIVLTHPHSDHVGGAETIIDEFETGVIYMTDISAYSAEYESLCSLIEKEQISVIEVERGVLFELGQAMCSFISPSKNDSYEGENDMSAVLRIEYGERAFLFMGDCEEDAENGILDSKSKVKADVVKVGHHGSNSSSTQKFIKATGAGYAVISCGADNDYGHPSVYAVDRWQSAGARVFRTDINSTVAAVTDGAELFVGEAKDSSFWDSVRFDGYLSEGESEGTAESSQRILWVLNTESHTIHTPSCYLAARLAEKVREDSAADIELLEAEGYRRCERCFK